MSKQDKQIKVLKALENWNVKGEVDSAELAKNLKWDHDVVVGVLKSLEGLGYIKTTTVEKDFLKLTKEGEDILKEGSPEFRLLKLVEEDYHGKIKMTDFAATKKRLGWIDVGQKAAMRLGWLIQDKNESTFVLVRDSKDFGKDVTKEELLNLTEIDATTLASLKKRKLVGSTRSKTFLISKTKAFSTTISKQLTDLNRELIKSGEWKGATFKPYNFNAAGLPLARGSLHPLMEVRDGFKQILIGLGFEEMPTDKYVESSFWNFDSLFQPQSHAVRDAHDTFYLSAPHAHGDLEGFEQYWNDVKNVHEIGSRSINSLGWRYQWSGVEAKKLLLRTHTTANTCQMLYKLASAYKKTGVLESRRFFSIDRVFRNETLDATHLAEFHQVEGTVIEPGVSLASLIAIFREFFKQIGITELKFKPAYNPYTEPSMEIFGYHPILEKWTEIGNSGVFRPEMIQTMGFPPDTRVLGWGLSLERPTMINYNVKDIRDLIGPKSKLSSL